MSITLGRNGHMENLLASEEVLQRAGIEFHPTDRGGDITYHGPGQIVGYPIFDLREWKRDVVAYVRAIEQVLIDALADFGIAGGRVTGLTGVWVDGAKDRRHRRAYQPLGDVARLCAERDHRSELLPVHRAVRADETGHFHGALGVQAHAGRSCRARWRHISAGYLNWRYRGPAGLRTVEERHMTDVVMPQMGESIVEGTLTKWLKKPGDHVERDEPLFEISTDKVDTEIPSPAAGTLSEVLVEEGKTSASIRWLRESTKAASARRLKPAARPAAAPPPQQPAAAAPRTGRASAAGSDTAAPPQDSSGDPPLDDLHHAAAPAPEAASRRSRRTAVAAGAQDGARIQHRSARR